MINYTPRQESCSSVDFAPGDHGTPAPVRTRARERVVALDIGSMRDGHASISSIFLERVRLSVVSRGIFSKD